MSDREKPDYERAFTTIEDCEKEIARLKDDICRKVKARGQTKQNKKDAMAGYNETLKELEADLDFNTEVIDELLRHMKLLDAQGGPKSPKLQSV